MGVTTLAERERAARLVRLMEAGDWRAVLAEYSQDQQYREPLLVWIRPSLQVLTFLAGAVRALGCQALSSVGCGCGTLEWLLQVRDSL